ncbi:MAG: sulfurtransferase complex subunit TusB [Ferrimonas sp.]
MSTLHTLSHCPSNPEALACLLRYRASDDPVLLLQDAVWMLSQPRFAAILQTLPLYALQDDLRARALSPAADIALSIISYAGFVQLTLTTHQQVTW